MMRRAAIAFASLALLVGCSSHPAAPSRIESFVKQQLAAKDRKQRGPKTLITTGIRPNGQPYLLDVYRLDDGRICLEHAWTVYNGHSSEGGCTPDNHPRTTFQNWTTYPGHDDLVRDETPWMVGIILDTGTAVKLRALRNTPRGTLTQDFTLYRTAAYPGNAFYVGRAHDEKLFTTVELLDARGAVLATADYVQD